MTRMLALSLFTVFSGCSRESMYDDGSFTQNVSDAFADCSEGEIRFLSGKHNIQTAFRRCGSNNFGHYRWAPDGVHLYFTLTHGAHIMNGLKKTITVVPTEEPSHGAGWLTRDILAVPLPPEAGDERHRVVLYNRAANTIHTLHLSVKSPQDLQAWDDKGSTVLMTAIGKDGARRPYSLDTATGEISRALSWLTQPVTHLNVARKAKLVGWSTDRDSEVAQLEDGKTLHLLPGVTRVVPHPGGKWVALELLGKPISHFDQKAWDQGTPEQKAREKARRDEWLKRQPDWVEKEVQPPEIHLLRIKDGGRFKVTSFYGDRLQWYPGKPSHLAFMMWGIEGKQLNQNIAFTDMRERLRMIDAGQIPLGITPVKAPTDPLTPLPRSSQQTSHSKSDP